MIPVTKPDIPPLDEYAGYMKKIWVSRWLTNNGEFAQLLETRLAEYLNVRNLSLISNGTSALQIALKALAIKGEVITTPFTFAATTNVILWENLAPVFADIDGETFNIDPADVERKITKKTSAILAVHVYGNPCYMEELQEIAMKHDLKLIYDAAHAFGVEYGGQTILSYGNASILSFHATKIFNTIEGGAIVARDDDLLEQINLMKNHGIRSEEEVVLPGINAKMNEFQAAMGLCNLKYVKKNIQKRKLLHEYYMKHLQSIVGLKFQKMISSKHNYGYMPVCFESIEMRNKVYAGLLAGGIKARKYFYPLTANSVYLRNENLVKKFGLKIADDIASGVLCLPLYSDLGIADVDKITGIVKAAIKTM